MKKRYLAFLAGLIFIFGCASRDIPEISTSPDLIHASSVPVVMDVRVESSVATVKPTAIPTPTPTPVPTPEPTEEPTPTPEPTKDPNRPMVALTFDDGPNEQFTMLFLDVLEKYDVPGTFFVIGTNLGGKNTKEILERMISLGCEIGMHDINHSNLTKISYDKNVSRIEQMRSKISGLVEGGYDVHLLRPPYGSKNSTVLKACKKAEVACILWSVDTMDWSNKNTSKIVKTVKKEVQNGSIILFHDRLEASLNAIDILIPWLKEQGYDIVTVSELLNSEAPIVYGKSYRYKHINP